MTSLESTRIDVVKTVEEFIESLRQLSIIIYDYQPENRDVLFSKLQTGFVSTLQRINESTQKMISAGEDVALPRDLIETIDRGENPDIYLKKLAQDVISQNQSTAGKVDAYKKLEKLLDDALASPSRKEEH